MANAAKEMLKLNSKLDAVLEKLVETESLSEIKAQISAALEIDDWETVKNAALEGAKLSEKHGKLITEEQSLREALEAIRLKMLELAQNN